MFSWSSDPQASHPVWRVSNGVFLTLAAIVVGLTWVMLVLAYPSLPSQVPYHFDISGAADSLAEKTWWSVYFPGLLQVVLTMVLAWLARHPEYSNLPSSLPLRLVPEPAQSKIRHLIAHLLVMTALLVDLIMAYVALAVVRVGLGLTDRLNVWAIFGLVGLLLVVVTVYSVWIARLTRPAPPVVLPPA